MVIKLTTGESVSFAKGDIRSFSVMPEGYVFIEGQDLFYEDQKKHSHRVSYIRTWIPTHIVKKVEMMTDTIFEDDTEYKKYQKFLEHGIDMTRQKISHTEVDPEEVKKKIAEQEAKKGGK